MSRKVRPMPTYPPSVERNDPRAARVFEQRFVNDGGRLTESANWSPDLLIWYRRRYWDYLNKFSNTDPYRSVLRRTYLDYINNPSLNAVASKYSDTYLIGCYYGAIANISTFFYLLLSHPDILPQYGDSKKETRWFDSLADCDWRMPLEDIIRSIQFHSDIPSDWPCDPVRKSLATQLATFAIDFLFFHEMNHIVSHHVDYVFEQYGNDIEELASIGSRLDSLDYRAFELNADANSASITVAPWLDEALLSTKGMSNVFANPGEALGAWTLAIGFLFLIFDPFPSKLQDYSTLSHPHPAVRLVNIYFTSMQLAYAKSQKIAARTERSWKRAFDAFESICDVARIPTAVWYSVSNESEAIYDEYKFTITHLQELFPKLEKFEDD